ncbi:DUF58 domain-containing protein [Pseudactinotalea sp. HY158]|uniref:DUF58 domain-containing protein n=1 Tax=Pseudactinotalea sp. HY158 TaxID=2654547 RepID=UPI00129D0DAB|nr:DUF58 domain-containing protein [Pseudactinotalea sp. HY158]QGH70745.1 DUF58 domain-containing protein [Pseudactinotalea sp. HY158]
MTPNSPSRLAKVRARLDLPTVRRASGLLSGRHRSIYSGHGQDFDEMALYQYGDAISDIDWKASAASGIPVIRRFVRESNLAMVLALDTGRNMSATARDGDPKSAVALFAAELICYLARARGDTVALVAGDAERLIQLPARGGLSHMEMLLSRAEAMWTRQAPASDLVRVLDRTLAWFTRRSLVVVITDEARPTDEHEAALRRLRTRHEVMFVQVADALPTIDEHLAVDDVDHHLDIPQFLRASPGLAEQAAAYVAERRARTQALLRRRGIESVTATSIDDLINQLIDLLGRQKRVHH